MITMPKISTLKLKPIDLGTETLGQRLARFRKHLGYTQVEFAKEIGIIQSLVSDYERGITRPHPEMLARFAIALKVSIDEIVGLQSQEANIEQFSIPIVKRIKEIEALSPSKRKTVLKSLDLLILASKG